MGPQQNLRPLVISVLNSGNLKMRPGETGPSTQNEDTNLASGMLLLQPHSGVGAGHPFRGKVSGAPPLRAQAQSA